MAGHLQLHPTTFLSSPNLGVQDTKLALFEQIEADGVRVVLTGDVADACVIGSAFVFDSLLKQGKFREFWRRFQAYNQASTDSRSRILVLVVLLRSGPMALQKRVMQRYLRRNYERGRARLVPLYLEHSLREAVTDRQITQALGAERARRFSSPSQEREYRSSIRPRHRPRRGRRGSGSRDLR